VDDTERPNHPQYNPRPETTFQTTM
jgi:hypothetical protein